MANEIAALEQKLDELQSDEYRRHSDMINQRSLELAASVSSDATNVRSLELAASSSSDATIARSEDDSILGGKGQQSCSSDDSPPGEQQKQMH